MISVFHSPLSLGERQIGVTQDVSVQIPELAAYSHQTLAVGGCWSATIAFPSSKMDAEEWFWNGLGRRIETYSRGGNMVWQGLVDEVSVNIGNRSIRVGPLLDISNKVKVAYSFRDFTTGETTAGEYRETDWLESTDSIEKYGRLEELVSGGQDVDQKMIELRNSYLNKSKFPKYGEGVSVFPGDYSVSLSCIGYTRLLEKQIYNKAYYVDTQYSLRYKIEAIIAENYNYEYLIPYVTDLSDLQIPSYVLEDKNRTGWGIIKDEIEKSEKDIVCGMFPNYRFVYREFDMSSQPLDRMLRGTFDYKREAGGQRIMLGDTIYPDPCEIFPGRHMIITDFNKPVRYPITDVTYNFVDNSLTINDHSESLGVQLGKMMLGPSY